MTHLSELEIVLAIVNLLLGLVASGAIVVALTKYWRTKQIRTYVALLGLAVVLFTLKQLVGVLDGLSLASVQAVGVSAILETLFIASLAIALYHGTLMFQAMEL